MGLFRCGHRRVFGSDTVPGCYEDLDEADLFVLVGSNAAWCHPVLYSAHGGGAGKAWRPNSSISIRVRRRPSETALLQLSLAPGQDGALFSGLLVYLAENNYLDRAFIAAHTEGSTRRWLARKNRAQSRSDLFADAAAAGRHPPIL